MVVFIALTLTITGSACLYLASHNQKWLAKAPSGKALLGAGGGLLVLGLFAWIAALRPLAGFFVALHVAMVCFFAFPYSAALLGFRQRNRRGG